MRTTAHDSRSTWLIAATVIALLAVSLGSPGASLAVTDPNPVRVHATVATGFGDGTRIYDISAGPGPSGTVTITEPVGFSAYPGTVTCFSVSGADAIVGAMVIQQGSGTGIEYGVVLRIHDAGPGGTGDTVAEETPWTTDVEPDCGIPAAATPMPVVDGYAAVGDASDGGPGSIVGAGTIDIGGGLTQSFDVSAERTPGGTVSGAVAMSTSAGGAYVGTVDCLSVFGSRAVVGVTLSQVPAPQFPTPYYQTIFVEDGATDTLTFNALSNFTYPDCAAGPEVAASPLVAGDFTVSTDPLPTATPTTEPTPEPSPEPTPTPTGPAPTAGPPAPPAIDFVTADGRELEVGGRPWRFTGINMYNAASDGWCNFAYDDTTFAAALDDIGLGGDQHGVIRAWFFQPQAIDKATDTRTWTRLDRVLRIAAEKGYRVIPTLTDHWGECGSDAPNPAKGEAWYAGGYTAVDPGMIVSYRDWVAEVVTRYRDDPTILGWQLINEAEILPAGGCPADATMTTVLKDWGRDVSDLIRSIDANHLISFGTIGGGQCGAVMTQWQDLHDLPNIDLCEVHDYSGAAAPPIYGDQWNGLQPRIDQCAALGKPLFVGEVGIENGIGLAARADAFERKLAYQANAGIVGHLAWGWRTTEAYGITAGDPTLDVLARGPYRVVTSIADIDDGSCDTVTGCEFREAMDAANAGVDNGSIRFDLPVGSDTIRPSVGFPGFNGDVIVDGRPLPGDTTPVPVVIDGSLAGGAYGLSIDDRVTIQGLEIRDFGGSGILVQGADNRIGGTEPGAGNRIVGNGEDGVTVEDRDDAVRNAILGNEIAGNGRLAINLGGHEPTLAVVGYPIGAVAGGTGPNERQFAPNMLPALPGDTTADGHFFGFSGRDYRIEVFWSPTCPPMRPDAATLLGAASLTMPSGSTPALPFSVPVTGGLPGGFLTATATDHLGNTSEVGPCAPVAGPFDIRLESLTVEPDPVAVSRTVQVTVTARNDGPSDAFGAIVAVGWPSSSLEMVTAPTLPGCETLEDSGSTFAICWPAAIPPSGSASLTVTLRAVTVGDVSIDAVATLLADGGDLDGSNDAASSPLSIVAAASTAVGSDVTVAPSDPTTGTSPVTMTFDDVLVGGETTLEVSPTGPTVPAGFQLGDPPVYYDIQSTATFAGLVEVCITYDDGAFADEGALRLYHYDATIPGWEDLTTSHDLVANRICGLTDSLSPFAIVERRFAFDGFFSPVDDAPVLNKVKAGAAVPVKFSLGGDQGLDIFADGSPSVRLVACPNTPSDPLEATAPAGANGLSYDPALDRYTWTWKTLKAWAGSCRELTITFSDGSTHQAHFWFTR